MGLIFMLKLLDAVEAIGQHNLLIACFLSYSVYCTLLSERRCADRLQSAIALVALGEDFLLLQGIAVPRDLQCQPAIRRVENNVRTLVFLRQIITHAEAIEKVVVFLDLAGQFQDIPDRSRRRVAALQSQRLAHAFAVVDTILQLNAGHTDVVRRLDFERNTFVGQHATQRFLAVKAPHGWWLIQLNVNGSARQLCTDLLLRFQDNAILALFYSGYR